MAKIQKVIQYNYHSSYTDEDMEKMNKDGWNVIQICPVAECSSYFFALYEKEVGKLNSDGI